MPYIKTFFIEVTGQATKDSALQDVNSTPYLLLFSNLSFFYLISLKSLKRLTKIKYYLFQFFYPIQTLDLKRFLQSTLIFWRKIKLLMLKNQINSSFSQQMDQGNEEFEQSFIAQSQGSLIITEQSSKIIRDPSEKQIYSSSAYSSGFLIVEESGMNDSEGVFSIGKIQQVNFDQSLIQQQIVAKSSIQNQNSTIINCKQNFCKSSLNNSEQKSIKKSRENSSSLSQSKLTIHQSSNLITQQTLIEWAEPTNQRYTKLGRISSKEEDDSIKSLIYGVDNILTGISFIKNNQFQNKQLNEIVNVQTKQKQFLMKKIRSIVNSCFLTESTHKLSIQQNKQLDEKISSTQSQQTDSALEISDINEDIQIYYEAESFDDIKKVDLTQIEKLIEQSYHQLYSKKVQKEEIIIYKPNQRDEHNLQHYMNIVNNEEQIQTQQLLQKKHNKSQTLYELLQKNKKYGLGQTLFEVSTNLSRIGQIYLRQGKYLRSIGFYSKCYEVQLKIYNRNSVQISCTLNNLGLSYSYNGQYENALQVYKQCKQILSIIYGKQSIQVSKLQNNIGHVHKKCGNYNQAIQHFQNSIKIQIKKPSFEIQSIPNTIVISLSSMAICYCQKGYLNDALQIYWKCIKILDSISQPNCNIYLSLIGLIGDVYLKQGQYQMALNVKNQMMKLQLQAFGPESINVGVTLKKIGTIYQSKGDYEKALENMKKCHEIYLNKFGPRSKWVGEILNNIGNVYLKKGYDKIIKDNFQKMHLIKDEITKAVHNYVQSLDILIENFLVGLTSVTAITIVVKNLKYLKQSLQIINSYLSSKPKVDKVDLINEFRDNAHIFQQIGSSYQQQGDYDLAIKYYSSSLQIHMQKVGLKSIYGGILLAKIGTVLLKKNQLFLSQEYLKKSYEILANLIDRQSQQLKTLKETIQFVNKYDNQIKYAFFVIINTIVEEVFMINKFVSQIIVDSICRSSVLISERLI